MTVRLNIQKELNLFLRSYMRLLSLSTTGRTIQEAAIKMNAQKQMMKENYP